MCLFLFWFRQGICLRVELLGHMVALFLVFWEFAVWLRKLKQGLCINLEGWNGEGDEGSFKREGIYVYPWLIQPMVEV